MKYEKLSAGCYRSNDGKIEIQRLPDNYWSWAIDGTGYDAEPTLKQAKQKAEAAAANGD